MPPPATPSKRSTRQGTNTRKSFQRVSTDLSHYDTSDPFTAMNALREVLWLLPNNPGAHQYKMTQAQHKLVMHLLKIVEPFVGPTISYHNIARLPTETLDNIVSHVDLKDDLLSLALTCRRIRDVIISRHFDYRVIKAKVSSTRVWHHLTVYRGLARNVRWLEIMDESNSETELTVPPKITTTDADVESTHDELDRPALLEKLFISAIAGMHGLQSFKWSQSRTRSLVSIERLWPTLRNCLQLSLVDLNDNTIFLPPEDKDIEEEDGSSHTDEDTVLTGVTTISIKPIKSSGTTKHPQLIRISGLLLSCHNLKDLDITYIIPRRADFAYPVADDFYSSGCWKNLTSLTLNNLWCTTDGLHKLATFLSQHDNLETLHFKSTGASTAALLLPKDTLPRLKELKSDREFANVILSCDLDASRPLKTLKGIDLSGSESDQTFFDNLARIGGNITRVELAGWNEMKELREFLEYVPKLTWLDVENHEISGHIPNKATRAYGLDDWTRTLKLVPDIVTFFGVPKLFHKIPNIPVDDMDQSDRSKSEKNKKIASNLAWECRKLKRLEHWEDGRSKVIILVRGDPECKYKVMDIRPENGNGF